MIQNLNTTNVSVQCIRININVMLAKNLNTTNVSVQSSRGKQATTKSSI